MAGPSSGPSDAPGFPQSVTFIPTRTVTVTQPVTALNVQSYGAPIKVTTAAGGPVRITESITFDSGDGEPADRDATLTLTACSRSRRRRA